MSFLLLETDQWLASEVQSHKKVGNDSVYKNAKQNLFKKFDQCIRKDLIPHRAFTNIAVSEGVGEKKYGIMFQNIASGFKGLLTFSYNKIYDKLSVYFHILNQNNGIFKFKTQQMLLQFVRYIYLVENRIQIPLKMLVNTEGGYITFQILYFTYSSSNIIYDMNLLRLYKSANIILEIFRIYLVSIMPVFEAGLKLKIPVELAMDTQQETKVVQNIYRYLSMMTMKAYFCVGEIVSEKAKVQQLQERDESGRNLAMRKVEVEADLLRNNDLYVIPPVRHEKKVQRNNRHQFYISGGEEKAIKGQISFSITGAEEDKNKKFLTVLNHIQLNNPEKIIPIPIHSGGFAEVSSAEVEFWIVESFVGSNTNRDLNPNALIKKFLAVKQQIGYGSKNLHEINILKEMKTGYIPLMPKYYIPINMPNFSLTKNPLIMMDYLTQGSLAQFMITRKHSVSLSAKMFLMLSITMGLMFLQKFKIVHLDLKPGNIMMAPALLIKLIDFGEAYHEGVVKKMGNAYRPGHTLPYGAPELLSKKTESFTSKTDIYALGIIFYEMIYGYLPVENREQFFFAPEKCDQIGPPTLIRILNSLISRCLSVNPQDRPELDWIAIIIRLCIEFVL